MNNDIHNYEDIIYLPHHVSKVHKPMSLYDRAAQFAPFAALTGYKEAVCEKERLTSQKKILDENQKFLLNIKLQMILENIKECPMITIIYFQKDKTKDGGSYVSVTEHVEKIDEYSKTIQLANRVKIKIDDIYQIKLQK